MCHYNIAPDNKVHGANMGPIWADRTQVGPMLTPSTLLSGAGLVHGCAVSIVDTLDVLHYGVDVIPCLCMPLFSIHSYVTFSYTILLLHVSIRLNYTEHQTAYADN